jgi:MoxR-like ATPase
VKHFMPRYGHGLLSGQWGTGKTFIVFDLAAALGTGQPFLGHARPDNVMIYKRNVKSGLRPSHFNFLVRIEVRRPSETPRQTVSFHRLTSTP